MVTDASRRIHILKVRFLLLKISPLNVKRKCDPLLYQQCCGSTSFGGHRSLLTPYIPETGVSNWVPRLWKAVDLWEGACMEASVNFQNVTVVIAATSSHHNVPWNVFSSRGLEVICHHWSVVQAAHSCILALLPWIRNKTYQLCPPLLTVEFSSVEHLAGFHLQWHGQGTKKLY